MPHGHPGLGQGYLLLLLILLACGSPRAWLTEATPTDVDQMTDAAVSPTPQAVEEMLIQEIAERICPYPDGPDMIDPYERYFSTRDRVYSLVCYPAAGHSITVTMQRFADVTDSHAGFQAASASTPTEEFHGFPVSDWQEQHPSFPGGRFEYRVRLLQVGAWLIRIRSFDDTHFLIAPDPREASEAIIQVVGEHESGPTLNDTP